MTKKHRVLRDFVARIDPSLITKPTNITWDRNLGICDSGKVTAGLQFPSHPMPCNKQLALMSLDRWSGNVWPRWLQVFVRCAIFPSCYAATVSVGVEVNLAVVLRKNERMNE